MPGRAPDADPEQLSDVLGSIVAFLLGGTPTLTRAQVAEQSGVPLEIAQELWRLLGFPQTSDDDVAFTPDDVESLKRTRDLVRLGVLSPDRQAALVRTWGRSYARMAEWQTALLTEVALEQGDPVGQLPWLAEEVLPRVAALQTYVWRRHLASAASRMLTVRSVGSTTKPMAVCFVDIVGYTSRSKSLDEHELMAWIDHFESTATGLVVDHGGRVIKNIGDEVLFVADDLVGAAEAALDMVALGEDPDDDFPAVRAGLAYGDVVNHLGDVFGATVNIAARLTSVARPGTVLIDRGAHEVLSGETSLDDDEHASLHGDGVPGSRPDGDPAEVEDLDPGDDVPLEPRAYSFRRVRRTSVKGYARLASWSLRRN